MKLLITGGAGFIGSHIADACIAIGHDVTIIDNLSTGVIENINPKAKFINIDIGDEAVSNVFREGNFDILIHHAAQIDVRVSVGNPKFDAHTNIVGSLNLYECCKEFGVKKIIFASSGGAVPGEQEYFPADELHPANPCSPYGISKFTNEKYLFYYKEIYGIDYAVMRYTNVYGPRQNPHGEAGVVAIFAMKMLSGKQPVINGDGKNSRDYVYVGDVARANLLALQPEVSGIYNVSTAVEHDVNFIFRTIKKLTGSDCEEIHVEAKAGEQRRSVCSYEKFLNNHGWKPEVEFAKGLELTVDFFKEKFAAK